MKAELQVMMSIGGRPIWMKKREVSGELTKQLTDADYDFVVKEAEAALSTVVTNQDQTTGTVAQTSKSKKK